MVVAEEPRTIRAVSCIRSSGPSAAARWRSRVSGVGLRIATTAHLGTDRVAVERRRVVLAARLAAPAPRHGPVCTVRRRHADRLWARTRYPLHHTMFWPERQR